MVLVSAATRRAATAAALLSLLRDISHPLSRPGGYTNECFQLEHTTASTFSSIASLARAMLSREPMRAISL